MPRLFFGVLQFLLLSIPAPIPLLAFSLLGFVLFPFFIEGVIAAVLVDFLFGGTSVTLWGFAHPATSLFLVLFCLAGILRGKVRLSSSF